MTRTAAQQEGTFCWIELVTGDSINAQAFYCALFSWTTDTRTNLQGEAYTLFFNDGFEVASCVERKGAQPTPPSHLNQWLSYILVQNCAEMVARAQELDAVLVHGPSDNDSRSINALLTAPDGSPYGLWQPILHAGIAQQARPGNLMWNELATPSTETVKQHFKQLLNWDHRDVEERPGFIYTGLWKDEQKIAGMFQSQSAWCSGQPMWIPYFMVHDLRQTTATLEYLKGTLLCGPMVGLPGVWTICRSPQGEIFAIMQP